MTKRTCSLALAVAVLLTASAASAAVPGVQSSGTQVPTMNNRNSAQRAIFFNKQGKEQSAPSHYAELWGDAALGG
jgi:hypothetical protein